MSTIIEQIKILKAKNLLFKSKSFAKKILMNENYYNIVNAFKDLFIDETYHKISNNNSDEKFIKGTTFEEVYSMFLFDKKIRNIFLKYFFIIENQIKSHISYEFAKKYGAYGYLKIDNFNNKEIFNVINLKKNINAIIYNNKNSKRINHFIIEKKECIPIWVLISFFNLGNTRIFYSNLEIGLQNKIANYYKLKSNGLTSMMLTMNMFRNVCAHDNRLYCFRLPYANKGIVDLPIHNYLNVKKINNKYVYGKQDLFSCVIIFKYLLEDSLFQSFFDELENSIIKLSNKLKCIKITKVLKKMGFPLNDFEGNKDWTNIRFLTKF